MFDISIGDIVKVFSAVICVLFVWVFKRQIANLLGNLIIGNIYAETRGKTYAQVMDDVKDTIKRILK